MDIEAFIEFEAPNDDAHDKAYEVALRGCHNTYKDLSLAELLEWQTVARGRYNSSHNSTAECMILGALINEKSAGKKEGK